jgi:hypothetical protein
MTTDRVDSWFFGFVRKLVASVPRPDWEEPTSPYWQGFKAHLVKAGVTERVADEATLLLQEEPPAYPDRVIPDFLAKCRVVFKLDQAEARARGVADAVTDQDVAKQLSENCDRCGGCGITVLYRQKSAKPGENPEVPFACLCPMGQFLGLKYRGGDEDARRFGRRLPNLADHPDLHGDEYRERRYFAPEPAEAPADPLVGYRGRKKLADPGPVPNVGSVSRERPALPQPRAEAS